jgi:hypothetical protein
MAEVPEHLFLRGRLCLPWFPEHRSRSCARVSSSRSLRFPGLFAASYGGLKLAHYLRMNPLASL